MGAIAAYGDQVAAEVGGMVVTSSLTDEQLQRNLPIDLEQLREVLRKNRIGAVWVFGSRARGDHREDSDIDLLHIPKGGHLKCANTAGC